MSDGSKQPGNNSSYHQLEESDSVNEVSLTVGGDESVSARLLKKMTGYVEKRASIKKASIISSSLVKITGRKLSVIRKSKAFRDLIQKYSSANLIRDLTSKTEAASISRLGKLQVSLPVKNKFFKCFWKGCSYTCNSSFGIFKHIRVHANDQSFECEFCPFQAKQFMPFKVHIANHFRMGAECKVTVKRQVNIHSNNPAEKREIYLDTNSPTYKLKAAGDSLSMSEDKLKAAGDSLSMSEDCKELDTTTCNHLQESEHCELTEEMDVPIENERDFPFVKQESPCIKKEHVFKSIDSVESNGTNAAISNSRSLKIVLERLDSNTITTYLTRHSSEDIKQMPEWKSSSVTVKHEKGIPVAKKCFTCSSKGCSYSTNCHSHFVDHSRVHADERPFSCKFCPYKAKRLQTLKAHTAVHFKSKRYVCPVCYLKSKNLDSLEKHMGIHKKKTMKKPLAGTHKSKLLNKKMKKPLAGTHKSELLNKTVKKPLEGTRKSQLLHKTKMWKKNDAGSKKRFMCTVKHCSYATNNSSSMLNHVRVHTGERPFKCKFCPRRTKTNSNLKTHTLTHFKNKKFVCPKCSYKTKRLDTLEKHMNTHKMTAAVRHRGLKRKLSSTDKQKTAKVRKTLKTSEKCKNHDNFASSSQLKKLSTVKTVCQKQTSVNDNAKNSAPLSRLSDTKSKIVTSSQASKNYDKTGDLKSAKNSLRKQKMNKPDGSILELSENQKPDMDVHVGQKQFVCSHKGCSYSTNIRDHLEQHFNVHPDERPFPCKFCPYKAKMHKHLKAHTARHFKGNIFACPVCHRKSRCLSTLEKHMNLHKKKKCVEKRESTQSRTRTHGQLSSKKGIGPNQNYNKPDKPVSSVKSEESNCTDSGGEPLENAMGESFSKKWQSDIHDEASSTSSLAGNSQTNTKSLRSSQVHTYSGKKLEENFSTVLEKCKSGKSKKTSASKSSSVSVRSDRWICSHKGCSYSTNVFCHFVEHKRVHTGERPFACPFCPYKAKTPGCRKKHSMTHFKDRIFLCPLCSHEAICLVTLEEHMKTHKTKTGKKPRKTVDRHKPGLLVGRPKQGAARLAKERFICSRRGCSFHSNCQSHYIEHMRVHTGERPFACPFCPYKGKTLRARKKHSMTHFKDNKFACHLCTHKAKRLDTLEEHVKVHEKKTAKERVFQNTKKKILQQKVPKTEVMKEVQKNNHEQTLGKKEVCTKDSRSTPTTAVMYACDICPYRTKVRHRLEKHMIIQYHKKEPEPFSCSQCSFKTNKPRQLKVHRLIHQGKAPDGIDCHMIKHHSLLPGVKIHNVMSKEDGQTPTRTAALDKEYPVSVSAVQSSDCKTSVNPQVCGLSHSDQTRFDVASENPQICGSVHSGIKLEDNIQTSTKITSVNNQLGDSKQNIKSPLNCTFEGPQFCGPVSSPKLIEKSDEMAGRIINVDPHRWGSAPHDKTLTTMETEDSHHCDSVHETMPKENSDQISKELDVSSSRLSGPNSSTEQADDLCNTLTVMAVPDPLLCIASPSTRRQIEESDSSSTGMSTQDPQPCKSTLAMKQTEDSNQTKDSLATGDPQLSDSVRSITTLAGSATKDSRYLAPALCGSVGKAKWKEGSNQKPASVSVKSPHTGGSGNAASVSIIASMGPNFSESNLPTAQCKEIVETVIIDSLDPNLSGLTSSAGQTTEINEASVIVASMGSDLSGSSLPYISESSQSTTVTTQPKKTDGTGHGIISLRRDLSESTSSVMQTKDMDETSITITFLDFKNTESSQTIHTTIKTHKDDNTPIIITPLTSDISETTQTAIQIQESDEAPIIITPLNRDLSESVATLQIRESAEASIVFSSLDPDVSESAQSATHTSENSETMIITALDPNLTESSQTEAQAKDSNETSITVAYLDPQLSESADETSVITLSQDFDHSES